jgi:HEAT repeat protein
MGWADEGWDAVLERWERQLIEMQGAHDPGLRRPPATEAELKELETRIGLRLPPSYRTFLLATNGANARAWTWAWWPFDDPHFDGFLPASRVQLLRRRGVALVANDAEEYERLFNIGGKVASNLLEPGEFQCQGHLAHVLVLNGEERQSNFFLDPLDMDANGEWRAWNFHGEDCGYYWSFGDLMDGMVATMAEYEEPKRAFAPGRAGEELAALHGALETGGPAAEGALNRLQELVTSGSPQERAPAMLILADSKQASAMEAVIRLVEEHPDDPVIVGNALDKGIGRSHDARVRPLLERALAGSEGKSYVSYLSRQWPELVEEAWRRGGDPMFLRELLNARRPGTLTPAIQALADPDLGPEARNWLTYTLSHSVAEHPDPPQPDAVAALAAIPANDRLNLAMALLNWGEVEKAVSVAGDALDHPSPTGGQFIIALGETKHPAAARALVASLRRVPSYYVLDALSGIDHEDSAPEIAKHLDGDLRYDALIGLEQLANAGALDILAERAAGGDLDATRALARHRDLRALEPLMNHMSGPRRRSAVTGLRDLRDPRTAGLLAEIAGTDPDDDVAVIAAQGLVMMSASLARQTVERLRQRADHDVVRLAEHWLQDLLDNA